MKRYLISTIFILGTIESYCQRHLFPPNILPNSTIRIVGFKDTLVSGTKKWISSIGTGFFYQFEIDTVQFRAIVTNKHVVEGSTYGSLTIKTIDSSYKLGSKIKSDTINFSKFNEQWIYHPNEDLAILPLSTFEERFIKKYKKDISYSWFNKTLIPSLKDSIQISAIEKVLMIGYPKSLWDSTNNLPVIRQGLTATPYFSDFNGLKRFLVDIPTFHGSSGSPILLYSYDPYWKDTMTLMNDFRTYLLGIAVESFTYDVDGKLVPYNSTPNIADSVGAKYKSQVTLPYNVAIAIKAEKLFDFNPLIVTYLKIKKTN